MVKAFNKVRNHFGVNKLGQIAAKVALEDQDHLKTVLKKLINQKKILPRYFRSLALPHYPLEQTLYLLIVVGMANLQPS